MSGNQGSGAAADPAPVQIPALGPATTPLNPVDLLVVSQAGIARKVPVSYFGSTGQPFIFGSFALGLTSTGVDQPSSLQLATMLATVTTVPPATGVSVPGAPQGAGPGMFGMIINAGLNALNLYALGGTINGNARVSIPPGGIAWWFIESTGAYYIR